LRHRPRLVQHRHRSVGHRHRPLGVSHYCRPALCTPYVQPNPRTCIQVRRGCRRVCVLSDAPHSTAAWLSPQP
jgi:hypothetical protein